MKGMFVNSNGCIPYAECIVAGAKTIETRNRNMLRQLVGERVAVVRTKRGKNPTIVGDVLILSGMFLTEREMEEVRDKTLIPPGSKYDCHGRGKWCYFLGDARKCEPYPLPADAVRHGISWVEFETPQKGDAND